MQADGDRRRRELAERERRAAARASTIAVLAAREIAPSRAEIAVALTAADLLDAARARVEGMHG